MGSKTKIEWSDATWSPVSGCSHISDGCRACFAEAMARRFNKDWKPWTKENAAHNVRLHPERLDQPLHWRKPKKIFVCSVSDLFHDEVPDEFIACVFAVMVRARRHTFQILTKRPERMLNLLSSSRFNDPMNGWIARCLIPRKVEHWYHDPHLFTWPLSNVLPGVTVENDRNRDRIDWLLKTPAAKRFVSIEPMLGPINLEPYIWPTCWHWDNKYLSPQDAIAEGAYAERKPQALVGANRTFLDWVIVGSESGPHRRETEIGWARGIRDQCIAAHVPFFLKQLHIDGKKVSNPELDGRTWEEMPK